MSFNLMVFSNVSTYRHTVFAPLKAAIFSPPDKIPYQEREYPAKDIKKNLKKAT